MALDDVIVSFDLHQLLGDDFDSRRIKGYITVNTEGGRLEDVSTGEIRLGDQTITIGEDGTGTFTTWAPGADGNPVSWQTTLTLDYPRTGQRDRQVDVFGPYTITGTSKDVTNKALTSNVATLTTSEAHGLDVGNTITVAGVDATFDGDYTITVVPSATTLSYAKTHADVASVADTGTLTSPNIRLASLEEEQAVPPAYATTLLATLQAQTTQATFATIARLPETIISGAVTRDSNGAATSAPVTWPDGTPGTYTADTVSVTFPGAVDEYHITYGSPVTATYTQPEVTRDGSGAVTDLPEIEVS